MSKNTTTSARLDTLEGRMDSIDSKIDRLISLHEAAVTPAVTEAAPEPAKAATRKGRKGKGRKASTGTTAVVVTLANRELRAALKAHKASGAIKAGLTVGQALEQGLMLGDGTLPGKGSKAGKGKATEAKAGRPVRTPEQVAAAEAKRQAQFEAFRGLQAALRAHKEAGLIRKGITVKEAIAEGLIDGTGALLRAEDAAMDAAVGEPTKAERKAAKKAKKAAKQAAALEADKPARTTVANEAPRRADGTITPKVEWADREALAMSGMFDRHQIDAIIAQYRVEGQYA